MTILIAIKLLEKGTKVHRYSAVMALVEKAIFAAHKIAPRFLLVTRGVTADGASTVPQGIRFFLEALQPMRDGMEKLDINIQAHNLVIHPLWVKVNQF